METEINLDALFSIVERGKKEWEAAVDGIAEGVALFEQENLTILRSNWTLAKFFDTTPHQLVGAEIHALLCGCDSSECAILSHLKSRKPAILEAAHRPQDAIWRLAFYPVQDRTSAATHGVVVVSDVTQEKQWQRQVVEVEKKSAMVRMVSSLADQLTPSMAYLHNNMYAISRRRAEIRSAFCDYRVALQTTDPYQTTVPKKSWESIESQHNVEFLLQDAEQALRQSILNLNHMHHAILDLGNLGTITARVQFTDLHAVLDSSLNVVWKDVGTKTSIDRHYGVLPLLRYDQIQLQTLLILLFSHLVQGTETAEEIKIITNNLGDFVSLEIERETSKIGESAIEQLAIPPTEWKEVIQKKFRPVIDVVREQGGEISFERLGTNDMLITLQLPINGPHSSAALLDHR